MKLLCFYNVPKEEIDEMAIKEGRIIDIEKKVGVLGQRIASMEESLRSQTPLGERVASLEGQSIKTGKSSNTILIAILSVLGLSVLWYWGWIGTRVVDIGTRIGVIEQTLRLSQVSADPTNLKNISEAKAILTTAQQKNIRIDPNILKETGDKFITTSSTQPASWPAVQQYLDYRSFLNRSLAPSPTDLKPVNMDYWTAFLKYRSINPPHGRLIVSAKIGPVSSENSARFELLDKPHPGQGVELFVIGGKDIEIGLDGFYLKNVIIRDIHIQYHGGHVILENVYFVNCVFDFEPGIKSQELGKAILASTTVTFKSVT